MLRRRRRYYYFADDAQRLPVILAISFDTDDEGNLIFKAIGSALSKALTYVWNITASGETDEFTTTGPELVLDNEFTEKYQTANLISVKVIVGSVETEEFVIELSNSVAGIAVAGVAISA